MAKRRQRLDRKRPNAPRDVSRDVAAKTWFQLCDKDLLRAALLNSEFDSKYHHMAVLLENPEYARTSLPQLARQCGVSLVDVVEKYRETSVALSHLLAQEQLPAIVAENAVDALPTSEVCPRCDGDKMVDATNGAVTKAGKPRRKRCPKCLGDGRIRIAGMTDAKKLLMQHEGLIEAGGGAKVQVNVGAGAIPNLMDAIEVQERALKLGEGKVVDVEADVPD